jgi:hypothetical protein
VYWTKPADLAHAPGRPPAVFGPWDQGSCWVVFVDGTVRALTKKEDGPRLPALISDREQGHLPDHDQLLAGHHVDGDHQIGGRHQPLRVSEPPAH